MIDRDPGSNLNAVTDVIAAALDGYPGGKLYVGYSGGLDSTVLLHAAHSLYRERVVALHVNHGLHAEAGAWQRHCARQCWDWHIELISRRVAVAAGNVEAAARAARYGFFSELLSADDTLLLAHHQDDQAETVMLRIAQGRGLIGMPARRRLGRGGLLRPLLELPRSALVDYAGDHRLRWVEDPTNADAALDRNYLRARVMPALRARWPDIGVALSEMLRQRRLVDEMLLAGTDRDATSLGIQDLRRGSAAGAAEVLRVWLLTRHAVAPSARSLRNFVVQLDAPPDRQPSLDLNVGTLRRYRDRVYHVAAPPALKASYLVELPGLLPLPHGDLQVIRSRVGGFAPAGDVRVVFGRDRTGCGERDRILLRGHRRDLKKLLQDARVPPWERGCYPLLEDDRGILAVPGVACRDVDPARGVERWEAKWQPHLH